jgi:PAS domain S-box-containing protein
LRTRSSKMAAMQKAVVTIGQDKIIRSVNREAIRLFGYQRADELIGYAPPPRFHISLLSSPLHARHLR